MGTLRTSLVYLFEHGSKREVEKVEKERERKRCNSSWKIHGRRFEGQCRKKGNQLKRQEGDQKQPAPVGVMKSKGRDSGKKEKGVCNVC